MLTVILAFAVTVADRMRCELPTPQASSDPSKPIGVITLGTSWQIEAGCSTAITMVEPAMTNLERWTSRTTNVAVDQYVPKRAVAVKSFKDIPLRQRYNHVGISGPGNTSFIGVNQTIAHMPWHVAIQQRWPLPQHPEYVLSYYIVQSPTLTQPFFIACADFMPHITCKAKTIEELEKELLRKYAQYLTTLLDHEAADPVNNTPGLDGAYIAWFEDWKLLRPAIPYWFDNGYILGMAFNF